jgi:hypothetical protein
MDSQGSKTGRLLSKASPLEVVADQGADGSYEIRVERGGTPAPEVVVVRAEAASVASAGRGRRWGLWLVVGAMALTGLGWLVAGRGGASRPTSLSVDGQSVPGPAGEPPAEPTLREAAAPLAAQDTGSPLPPTDPLLEPNAVPLSAATALGVALEPVVEPVRAVLPAAQEAAPEGELNPEDEGLEGEEGPDPGAGESPEGEPEEGELNPEDEGLEGEEPAPE